MDAGSFAAATTATSCEGEASPSCKRLLQKKYKKFSRNNTRKEKLMMNKLRRKRKKRKKAMKLEVQRLKKEVALEKNLRKQVETSLSTYRSISRTYWERWRWELHKRREAIQQLKINKPVDSDNYLLHEINPLMLKDPTDGEIHKETYLARGCFGIVRLQEYRNMPVAVKEFLPRSLAVDVKKEACILASLSHPYVPYLYGICTKKNPLRIVMQFHSVFGGVSTLEKELLVGRLLGTIWIVLCAQLMEVIHYLHEEVGLLHNDIKGDNVLLTQSLNPEDDCQHQIILIDFGKATKIEESKCYNLSAYERGEYIRRYPHIPPEVIEGDRRPYKGSDIYAIGKLLYKVCNSGVIDSLDASVKTKFKTKCCNIDFTKRPLTRECLQLFEKL